MHTDYARRCVTGSGRLCGASRQPSQAAFLRSASRTPTELNPYVCDLRFYQLLYPFKGISAGQS
jgi:hypothetical protein